jgi:hypothetical protein
MRLRPGAWSVRRCLEIVTLGTVTACAPAPDATHTVDYYRAHAQERAQLLSRCDNDPGGLGRQPNCVNGQQAERVEGVGSLKSLPPMGLSAPSSGGTGR